MYKIHQMKTEEISEIIAIWQKNYVKYHSDETAPNFFSGGQKDIENYLDTLGTKTIEIPYTTRAWIAQRKD